MKNAIVILAIVIISGCASSVATYEHSGDTHKRAVKQKLDAIDPSVPFWAEDATVYATVGVTQSGEVYSVEVRGGGKRHKQTVLRSIYAVAPFPPHGDGEPTYHKTTVTFP